MAGKEGLSNDMIMKKSVLLVLMVLVAVRVAAQDPDSLAIAAADSLYHELSSATIMQLPHLWSTRCRVCLRLLFGTLYLPVTT